MKSVARGVCAKCIWIDAKCTNSRGEELDEYKTTVGMISLQYLSQLELRLSIMAAVYTEFHATHNARASEGEVVSAETLSAAYIEGFNKGKDTAFAYAYEHALRDTTGLLATVREMKHEISARATKPAEIDRSQLFKSDTAYHGSLSETKEATL